MTGIFVPERFRGEPQATERFTRIVAWALAHHPFYQAWIRDPARRVPVLTREVVLENNDALLNGHPETAWTSGSTGVPVRISWSERRSGLELEMKKRVIAWRGGPLPAVSITLPARGHGQRTSDNLIDVRKPVAEQAEFILRRHREAATVAIITYPSNAEMLCRHVLENDLPMEFIRRVGCYSEPYEDALEALIKRAFPNAATWTNYSAQEVGLIAARCPYEPDFHHIMGDKLGVEVLDEHGHACAPGETGRIVVTDYFNINSPLIRYDLGDLVAPGNCPCGRIALPALRHIFGKVRGALKGRDGVAIMFVRFSSRLRHIAGLRQYQVVQKELERFEFRYVMTPGSVEPLLETAVTEAFEGFLGYAPRIDFRRATVIERGPGGKFYASICEV